MTWGWQLTPRGLLVAKAWMPSRGRSPFAVEIRCDGQSLRTRCTCPVKKGGPCSHRVALGLLLTECRDNGWVKRTLPNEAPAPLTEESSLPLVPHLHLNREGRQLWAELLFYYGDYKITPWPPRPESFVEGRRIVRAPGEERKWVELLRAAGFQIQEGQFFRGVSDESLSLVVDLLKGQGFLVGDNNPLLTRSPREVMQLAAEVEVNPGMEGARPFFTLSLWARGDQQQTPADELRRWIKAGALPPAFKGYEIPADLISRYEGIRQQLMELPPLAPSVWRVPTAAVPYVSEVLEGLPNTLLHPRFRQLMEQLSRTGGEIPPVPLPPNLPIPLRSYQIYAYHWLHLLASNQLGALLADDMGLGKTATILVFLWSLHQQGAQLGKKLPPSIIVAPTSLLDNWAQEARRFTPGLVVEIQRNPRPREVPITSDVVITSYSWLRRHQTWLAQHRWSVGVLDEAQAIKNPEAQTTRAVLKLRVQQNLALTGTPLENHPEDLWSQFRWLQPDLLGTRPQFITRYVQPVERGIPGAVDLLRRRVRTFMLRRVKEDVLSELPPLTTTTLMCELSSAHLKVYHHILHRARREVGAAIQQRGLEQSRMTILQAITRLRLAACHPALVDDEGKGEGGEPTKLELLLERLEQIAAEGHRALVFSQFVKMLDLIEARLPPHLGHLRLDGQTPPTRRQQVVDTFQATGGPPILLVSLKTGGTGLNLAAADHVFHYDPWWNPAVEDQATDRAHRLGQTRPVFAWRLVSQGTIEERVLRLHKSKRAWADMVLTVEHELAPRVDLEALSHLLFDDEPPLL